MKTDDAVGGIESGAQGQSGQKAPGHQDQAGRKFFVVEQQQGKDASGYADDQADGNRADGLDGEMRLDRFSEQLKSGYAAD